MKNLMAGLKLVFAAPTAFIDSMETVCIIQGKGGIFLTHSHWDHINNIDLYPNAGLIMSKLTYKKVPFVIFII